MQPSLPHPPRIAVVGGEPKSIRASLGALAVRFFASSRSGGRRRLEGLARAIRAGSYAGVVLRVRWLGHRDSDLIRAACAHAGVPMRRVQGSQSDVRHAIDELVRGARHAG